MPQSARAAFLDMFRGSAVLLMLVYHFCFDLNYYGVADFRFQSDPFWLGFRTAIVSGFVLAVGISLALSTKSGLNPRRFFRRQAILGAAAAMVSLGTYLIFPLTWVVFGILHFIFVGRLLALAFLRFKTANLFFGIAFLLFGILVEHPYFDHPRLHWLGMMTHKPFTEDYVPVLPWFGVLLLGLFLGRAVSALSASRHDEKAAIPGFGALTWLGRHSLIIYLFHQPVFMGVLHLVLR